jgi:hypothetical protein
VNVLDENVAEEQRLLLDRWRVAVRQIGIDAGSRGMTDEEIVPLLQRMRRPTFFTLDADFYRRNLCHRRYCLVWLDVRTEEVAEYVRRFLRHPKFNTQAKRMGCVVAVTPSGISAWKLHAKAQEHCPWPTKKRK